jgi:hypothetical protein
MMIGKRSFLVLFFAVFTLFLTFNANGAVPGDADGSDTVDLKDAIIALQIDSGTTPPANISVEADVNDDQRLGVVDAIFDIQSLLPHYNEDGSIVRVFSDEDVNRYETVQQKLSAQITANDETAFHNIFERYINALLENSAPLDSIPSYAPRGNAKSITIDVVHGKIDYSDYALNGDINSDLKVDFADLDALKTALFSGHSDAKYDVNSDTRIDTLDMIFLVARIGIEIHYFDFYTMAGEKLANMPIREASDPRFFDYAGSETRVMLVPKDINRVSGFISGLSDIDEVWYKKTGWVYQDDAVVRETSPRSVQGTIEPGDAGVSKGKIIKGILEKLIDFDAVKNDPYLVGWHIHVRYIDAGRYKALDTFGMDGSVSYIQPFEDKIRAPYFAKTTMNNDKLSVTKISYALQLGAETPTVNVQEMRQSITASLVRDGETVFVQQIIHASSDIFTSKEERTLSCDTWGSNNKLEGTVTLYRIGPYPDEKDFGSAPVTQGNFRVPALPYGAYKLEFENKCGCPTEIDSHYIFIDENTHIIGLEETAKNVTVGLTIITKVEDADEPLKNSAVTITSSDCVAEEKTASGTTNEEGFVEFNEIPIGKYDVSVDGEVVSSLSFCDNYTGTIIVPSDPLWKFKVVYSNPDYGGGTITATNIEIDFEAEADPGGIKIYAMGDSVCTGDLFGCGDFYIFNDTIVTPGSKWISFSSNIFIDPPQNQLKGEMISAEFDYGMNGLVCDGHIPEGFNADSETTTWTYSNGYSSWTLTLEPCASEGCDP